MSGKKGMRWKKKMPARKRRSVLLTVRITREESAAVRQAARELRVTVPDYLRSLLPCERL